ncbi:MAG: hypothetical protein H7X77_10900 [Anaerolineae bacterium]|nr:hypothetical protein [Anaerolineae bacterium]
MPVHYEWVDDSHFAMNLYLEAPWGWEEFDGTAREVYGLLREHKQPCGVVVNVSKMGGIPKGNVLAHLQQVERLIPDNVFVSVLVGAPYAATVFMNILMKIRPRAKRMTVFANTREEAYSVIRRRQQVMERPVTQQR